MLNIKATLVALVLGSSSVALASPSVTFTADAQAAFSFGPQVRDHRTPSYSMPSRQNLAWIELSNATSLRSGRAVIRPELSNLSQLRLQATRGMTYVNRVEVRFRNGTTQTLTLNRWLTTSIDLTIRNNTNIVDSITLVGSANRSARVQMFGMGSRVVEVPQPPVYQPPVYQPPVYQPPVVQPSYGLNLGQDMSFMNTDGRRFMDIGADKGAYNTLRLQGASGTTYVQMVQIDFVDGTQQFLGAVNKTLYAGQSYDIALDGYDARTVRRVTVWTDSSGRVIESSTGTFNASLL